MLHRFATNGLPPNSLHVASARAVQACRVAFCLAVGVSAFAADNEGPEMFNVLLQSRSQNVKIAGNQPTHGSRQILVEPSCDMKTVQKQPLSFRPAIVRVQLDRDKVQPGGTIQATFTFRSNGPAAVDTEVFVHVIRPDGRHIGADSGTPDGPRPHPPRQRRRFPLCFQHAWRSDLRARQRESARLPG